MSPLLVQPFSLLYEIDHQTFGRDGINLINGDGAVRWCYPILAAYVGDYPEQLLVSIVKFGNCPICPAPCEDMEDWDNILEPHNTGGIITALNSVTQGATKFTKACADEGIKPVQCVFWRDLPFINIYSSIMPNILHQLFQGILKHLILWICMACGDAEVDACFVAYLKTTTSYYSWRVFLI